MLRFCFALTVSIAGGALAVYPDGSSANGIGNQGYPNAYGYGYSGFLNNYLNSMYRQHQEFLRAGGGLFSYSYASSSPNGNAIASSSITFNRNGIQNQAQAGFIQPNGLNTRSGFGNSYGTSYSGSFGTGTNGGGGAAFSGFPGPDAGAFVFPDISAGGSFGPDSGAAFASGSVGPGGIHQTASVFPENPNVPNINTRFAGSGQPDGFHSVFTSSSSLTTNVDGKPKTIKQASTTVNDNGKITTYTAKNP
nr:probable peroxisomal membrane protein PEX13 isoform X2 [Leptinotarsa decemlineata]